MILLSPTAESAMERTGAGALVSFCRQMGTASQKGAEITDLEGNNRVRD